MGTPKVDVSLDAANSCNSWMCCFGFRCCQGSESPPPDPTLSMTKITVRSPTDDSVIEVFHKHSPIASPSASQRSLAQKSLRDNLMITEM